MTSLSYLDKTHLHNHMIHTVVFRVFCMETAYYVNDVIISNSREQLPQVAPAPLRTPMVVDLLHS